MKKIHKIIAVSIMLVITVICHALDLQMTEATSQNLVTFFSVVFGFYMTAVAILYNSSYTHKLYNQIDEKNQRRGIHTLQNYLLISGYWSIFSITSVVIFTIFAKTDSNATLYLSKNILIIPHFEYSTDLSLIFAPAIFGVSGVNIFFMILLLHTILDGMLVESKP